jgi:chromosome segregation ATPase
LAIEADRVRAESANRCSELEVQIAENQQQFAAQFEAERQKLVAELDAKTSENSELSEQAQGLKSELEQWKETANVLRSAKLESEQSLADLQGRFDDLSTRFGDRIAAEAQAARSQSEHAISLLKKENRELRDVCANAKNAIAQTEQKNREILEKIARLESENEQCRLQRRADGETAAREKQLSLAKAKALALQTEMNCQHMIDQVKSACETDKRNLLAFVIGSFQAFFDGRREINDDSLKSVVEDARNELDRLRVSDEAVRRLLGVDPRESTEAAILNLLRDRYR